MSDTDTKVTPEDFDAVLFDLDGVVTSTASVHASAWKELFDEYLRTRAVGEKSEFVPFDADSDYRQYVDGRPRYDGVRSFLESRGIDIPYGAPDDSPDAETCCGLGNKKNRLFRKYLREHGADVFVTTIEWIGALRSQGLKTAVVSSSKNCQAILERTGIEDLFDVRVDGAVAEEEGIEGKPAPDTFLAAAERLGVEPHRAVVVEDAISGVQAGNRGNFGLVIGVDRADDAEALIEHGADVVVEDLVELHENGPESEN